MADSEMSLIRRMNGMLKHRGPDSEGFYTSDHVILAMRRLSIIDVEGGCQPIYSEARDVVLVCNGEIYNFAELRDELEAKGHHFASHSDAETVVHAYEEYGDQFLSRLRGMFALALWDERRKRLLLARDRLGEKPLYYHADSSGRFWFSSELRSLFQAVNSPLLLTPEAFNLFLTFQYLPEPASLVASVHQLPAGNVLELTPENPKGAAWCYSDMAELHENPDQPVATIKQALDEACRLMGTADVPVAVALSGGIDSSLVAAITARYYQHDLHAFTIGYEGKPATDERSQAEELAQHLGIGFSSVELTVDDVISEFPLMMSYMDTPVADIAAYGYFAVSRAARKAGYPVLLSGMGGDEFFWGYEWVRDAVKRNESYQAARGWRYRLARLTGKTTANREFFEVHAALRDGDKLSRELMPRATRGKLDPNLWLTANGLDPEKPIHLAVTDLLNRTWLRSNCLALVDRMSMANSVEVRLPLLDVDLVSKVVGMRNDGLADWSLPHKDLLVRALRDVLPADVLGRKKQGFTPPVSRWMNGIVSRYKYLIRDGSLVRQGLLDPDKVSNMLQGFDFSFLYKLVFLECWSRMHLENESAEEMAARAQANI